MTPERRIAGRIAGKLAKVVGGVVVVAWLTTAAFVVVGAGPIPLDVAAAQPSTTTAERTTPEPATAPCFEGAPPRTGAPGNGPAPVGRCTPTAGQRVVDNLVWVWLVALLAIGVVVAVRGLRRDTGVARRTVGSRS